MRADPSSVPAPATVSLWGGAMKVSPGTISDIKTLRVSKRSAKGFSNQKDTGREVFSHDTDIGDLDRLPDGIYDSTAAAEAARKSFGLRTESQVD